MISVPQAKRAVNNFGIPYKVGWAMPKRAIQKSAIPAETIASRIYFVRGLKVMLDRDLAELYGVQTMVLKQAVRRNINRFPFDFVFEFPRFLLTKTLELTFIL